MENLPDAELKWVEECGHVPHLEQSKETARIITEFLESEELLQSKKATGVTKEESSNGINPAIPAAIAAAGAVGIVASSFL